MLPEPADRVVGRPGEHPVVDPPDLAQELVSRDVVSAETRLIPRLVAPDADRAIAFYRAAFGAEALACHRGADGRVVHAELSLAGAPLYLSEADRMDPSEEGG